MSPNINYRSIAQMNDTIRSYLPKLPWIPEVICGIHKSGMLAASLFSAHLNVPVLPFRSLHANTKWVYAGARSSIPPDQQHTYMMEARKILVVEDAATTGNTIRAEQRSLNLDLLPKHKLFYVVVYGAKPEFGEVHDVIEVVKQKRLFEWNWNNHTILKHSAVAMEGLLCHPPEPGLSTPEYVEYVKNAKPFILPKKGVGVIVSGRSENFRRDTVQWLKRHGVKFGKLVMPASDVGAPQNTQTFKKLQYIKLTELSMFVEPDHDTAMMIHGTTNRPVFSVSKGRLLQDWNE